ncbi:LOW QUALITY PROTEIN: hypothetical protein T265_13411 [Opisthorchis viverrini]|uniref:Uncharacterized protein n=1 Tax=Opisthorchis viverrini TaxID=6198 RepID=A0A075AH09_OPIVI|nr:LOW QUALITY PROTEIN: hypothetical protein T265_13411 [Opisthorchis viverrini]KER29254.1 LOW QUALITY PROTEIN: hypothetical protein T265_13411 [Opisthorchis viverrini]
MTESLLIYLLQLSSLDLSFETYRPTGRATNVEVSEIHSLICKLIWSFERLIWNPAESLVCGVLRQLNVLHQAASCFSRYDIRDIAMNLRNDNHEISSELQGGPMPWDKLVWRKMIFPSGLGRPEQLLRTYVTCGVGVKSVSLSTVEFTMLRERIIIIIDSMTLVFNTDTSLPYNHDLFERLIVKKRVKVDGEEHGSGVADCLQAHSTIWHGAFLILGEMAQVSANLLTGRSVVRNRSLSLDFPCLGLTCLAVSKSSCFVLVAWKLGTERVLQMNDYMLSS